MVPLYISGANSMLFQVAGLVHRRLRTPLLPADIDELASLVAGLEPDGKGAPVLLRQYLRLGGRVLGFNVDTEFANSLDCLILVDLRKTDPKVLRRYMSDSAWARFQQSHRARAPRNGMRVSGGVG